MWSKNLGENLELREIDEAELARIQGPHFERIFSNRSSSATASPLSAEDKTKIKARAQASPTWWLRLGLYLNNEVVGWHLGSATNPETYYMQNSAILENHRNRGFYSRMLAGVLERLKEEGFQVVTSLHHPNNSAVIIPKLRKGFVLSGMQLHERFSFLVEMKLFFSKERRMNYEKQIGLRLSEE